MINACGRDKAKTVIFLDNGSIVASPLSVAVLISRIDKATANGEEIRNPNKNAKMRVYDVIEEVDYMPNEHESVYDTKFNDILEEFENNE